MTLRFLHVFPVAALVAATAFAPAAHGQQRLSLAERVDRLEQQSAAGSGAVESVNQVQALQTAVQELQGQVEELRHALEQARQQARDQYVDLDSRIERLEGGAGAAPPPAGMGMEQPPDIDLAAPGAASGGALAPADEPAAADPADAPDAYNAAFASLKDGRYAESARRFEAFTQTFPQHELAPNAWYWLGESYYVTQNYDLAEEAFQTLLARWPNSQKAPDALLKVGYSQYERRQWNAAETTLNEVIRRYPDTTVARLAQSRLRALSLENRP